jgi:phosphoribosyl-ATP pyrophosphohydrolase
VLEEDKKSKALRNAANLKQLLRRRTDLQKLATTPLLGAMICALYQDREDKVPRERLKLYEECVEMLLERREEKKGVNLDTDYADLSYSQKLVLLQALAYWMLDNTYSAASVEDVETQFAARLPALDLRNISEKEVRRLFVERTGLLQEAIVDEISFRHRTFQEFFAAKEAIKNNNLGVLIKNARDDQWRETIILAVGVARPDERAKLLRGILKKAVGLKIAKSRHQLYLLALACLETCTELDPAIRQEIVAAARSVFPPHSQDEVSQIAKAGDYAVDLLSYDPDYPAEIAVLCIQTLAEIGGEIALAKLEDYRIDERNIVQSALDNSWNRFEAKAFVDKILQDKQKLTLTEIPSHESWWQLVPWVTQLDLSGPNISDLSPLASLTNLSQLNLSGPNISDLSPLAKLPALSHLGIGARIRIGLKGQVVQLQAMEPTSVKDYQQFFVHPSLRILGLHESMSIPDLDMLRRKRGLAIYTSKNRSLYRYVPPTE